MPHDYSHLALVRNLESQVPLIYFQSQEVRAVLGILRSNQQYRCFLSESRLEKIWAIAECVPTGKW